MNESWVRVPYNARQRTDARYLPHVQSTSRGNCHECGADNRGARDDERIDGWLVFRYGFWELDGRHIDSGGRHHRGGSRRVPKEVGNTSTAPLLAVSAMRTEPAGVLVRSKSVLPSWRTPISLR